MYYDCCIKDAGKLLMKSLINESKSQRQVIVSCGQEEEREVVDKPGQEPHQ